MKKKTGLYFGSFNPIHIGHLIVAEYLLEHSDLQELWFVVSPANPLKKRNSLLDDRQRWYMVNLAIGDDLRFRVSDVEFGLPQPSYTCHTLVHLREKYPDRDFALIMGADNLETFHKWLNYEWILENFALYVYPRPGYSSENPYPEARITMVDAPQIELSSTVIRENIRQNIPVRYMLPEKVFEYIDEMGFYKY
ncbi:MAG: nicotinate-nucleotide adenylyltransferase [Bacteroidales bacterium]|nr:nicotinate-nucleotide adenylyltransferase [Bacteroidales bacterium]